MTERPDDCTFLYFKPGGKWKYEGRGRFPTHDEESGGYQEVDRAAIVRENGGMPGITSHAEDLVVVVVPDESCSQMHAYPRMLRPEVKV